MLTKFRGEIYLILGALVFSFNGVVSTVALQEISAFRLAQIRNIGAFLVVLGYVAIRHRNLLHRTKSDLIAFIPYGVIGMALVQVGYFIGIQRGLPLSFVLLVEFTAPIWIALWIKYVRKMDVPGQMWFAIALALFGLLLLAQIWKGFAFDLIGFLGALGSAFAITGYFLIGKKLGQNRSALELTTWGLGVSAVFWIILLPVWNFPFDFFNTNLDALGIFSDYTIKGWAVLLWIIVMGTVIPYLFVIGGLRLLSESTSSVIGLLEPIFAGVFAWIWLQQSWNGIQLLGGVIILVGIYLADRAKSNAH